MPEQAGGPTPGPGQATVGTDSRKLTKAEAGYREDGGIANLQCGDCRFFEAGACQIVEGSIDPGDVCDLFEPNLKDGNVSADQATETRQKPLSALDMFITRVTKSKGVRRWYATSSGIKQDLYGERMSVDLFNDFIARIRSGESPPAAFTSKAWNGGNPYLGVAHYLDLDGFAIVGPTNNVWVDGETLKAKGSFADTPLALRAYEAIRQDIATKRADDERVRISIAFIDWGHHHSNRQFIRESLADRCMLCEAGVGNKQYTNGQLVHLALTRRPAYPETDIVALEEKSMSKRRDDAASIVGDELAEELENRTKELVGRTDGETEAVAPGAIVVKDEAGGEEEVAESTLDGAMTLDEAEAFLTKSANGNVRPDTWHVLEIVLGNIAGEDTREDIRAVLRDFQETLDVQTAKAVVEIQRAIGGETVPKEKEEAAPVKLTSRPEDEDEKRREREEAGVEDGDDEEEEMDYKSEPHPLDAYFAKVRESYDEALATPSDPETRLQMIQESFDDLGKGIQEQMSQAVANAPVDQAAISRALGEALSPLLAEFQALRGQLAANAEATKVDRSHGSPPRRALRMPTIPTPAADMVERSDPNPSEDNPTPKLRNLVRRSTVEYEKQRGR